MKNFKQLLVGAVAVLASALSGNADDRFVIDFETSSNYASVSTYDWWDASPFRVQQGAQSPLLNPANYVRVVDNPYDEADAQTGIAANGSSKVLAFQRSRQGSNMFGARIDLTEAQRFELTSTTQYVHVLMHKPVEGRAMLIGLGRHNSSTANYSEMWADQPNDVVQFTILGNNKPGQGAWSDVVFPIKGVGKIDIYSLVVVVDCEATHNLSDDFVAYIDNVTLNDVSTPAISLAGDYPISFDPETVSRSDRYLNSVSITTGGKTYVKNVEGRKSYTKAFDDFVYATPGSTVTVQGNYHGNSMHSFVYFDKDSNGKFDLNADLVASNTSNGNGYGASHTFTIPSNCAPGVYRLRFKVDWSDTEPAGSMVSGNDIIKNGGCILDALFYISAAEGVVNVTNDQRNGAVVQANGEAFSGYTHAIGTALTVKSAPAPGFTFRGMTLRYGNVNSEEEEVHSNPQYISKYVSYKKFSDEGTYTIPARYLKSDLYILGDMVETSSFQPATATFPYLSPEPSGTEWTTGTKAYHIKNYSNNAYMTTTAVDTGGNLQLSATTVPTTGAGQWVVCGDDEDGYRFYNVAAGTSKVLGMTGSEGDARIKLYDLDPDDLEVAASGVTTRFFPSQNGNKGYAFRMEAGSNNCWNFRQPYLALWNDSASPTGNGSTFVFSNPTDLEGTPEEPETPEGATYTLGSQITDLSQIEDGGVYAIVRKAGAGYATYYAGNNNKVIGSTSYPTDGTAAFIFSGNNTDGYTIKSAVADVYFPVLSTGPSSGTAIVLGNTQEKFIIKDTDSNFSNGVQIASKNSSYNSGSCNVYINSGGQTNEFVGYHNQGGGNTQMYLYKVTVTASEPSDPDDDEPTVCTIDKSHGSLSGTGTWHSEWVSTDGQVTFTSSANNMNWATSDSEHLDARSGSSQNATYTLTCTSTGKRITNVTVTLKSLSTSDQTWVIDGTSYTINQTARTVTLEDISAQSITMVNTGANNGTLLTDFNVTLSDYDPYAELLSESYAKAKWLQITNASNTSYAMTTKSGDTGGSNLHTALCNAGEEGQLFAFVGDNTNGFVIYNKALGSTYSLKTTGTGDGTAATWTTDTPQKWYLNDAYVSAQSKPGYVITPNVSSNMGLNMYGGAGGDAKFYGAGDGGTHWQLSPVSSTPTIIHYVVSGTKAHQDANNYVGLLNVTKGSYNSNAYITPDYNGRTENLYLPKGGQTVNVANTKLHGWSCAVSQTGGEYTVTYTAEETDYQYLAFNETAQWYRIPAIAQAYNGDLVAIYDYRVCHNDVGFGEVDQMMRRSTDVGLTWSEETKIADGNGGGNHFGAAYGDPALVADRESGKMTLITVSGQQAYPSATATSHPMVAALYSTDNGQSWSTPVDITSQFWGAKGAMFQDENTETEAQANGSQFAYSGFFGSGKILQSRKTKVGSSYRLYAAMLCRGRNISGAYVVYSDDMGHTWNLLGGDNAIKACSGSDEPKVEELPNGDIVLSGRKSYGRYFNIWHWTTAPSSSNTSGAGSWGTDLQSNQQTGGITVGANSCNGEILLVEATNASTGQPATLMLQSLPAGSGRSDVEIWYKDITDASTYATTQAFAQNWTKGLRVSNTTSAYSTMTLQADGNIGFFYEEGPATYCMVYVPLSVAKITDNAYNGIETPVEPTTVDVTYNIYLGDTKIGEKIVTETIGAAPTFTLGNPDYVTVAETLPTAISSSVTSYDLHTSYTNLPFTPDDKYYNIKISVSGSGTFWWYSDNGSAKELKDAPTSGNESKAMWVIGGDWYNGFTIQNRADSKYVASPALDSNNVQANLVSELSSLAKFELVRKSGSSYCFKVKGGSTYLAHTSNKTLNLSMWNVESYNGNVLTFAEVGDVPAVLQEKIEAFVGPGTKIGSVGYPQYTSDEYVAILNYSQNYGDGITNDNYDAALAAYNALIGTSDIVLPEAGHAYKLSVRSTDGTKHWYLKNDGTVSENESDAAIFVMGASGDEDFGAIFVTNDNDGINYLKSNGASTGTYAEKYCDFQIAPMVAVSNSFITTNKTARFGSFILKAKLRHDQGASGTTNGAIILKEETKAWDKSDAPYMSGTYTSAIEMTEVEYPYTAPKLVKNEGDAGAFASIWLPFPMLFPEGVEVYKGTQERDSGGNSFLGLERVDTDCAVAKGGYILYSESLTGEIKVQPVAGTPADKHEDGDAAFCGSTEPNYTWSDFTNDHEGTPYVLANKSKGIGFYKYIGTTLPKGKAIWMAPNGNAETVKFGFDDVVSAINALHGNTTGAEIFDLQGHRLNKVQKGQINVVNGQKVMFK